MTLFYLIRHGETDWNVQGIWQGHTDVPLNDIGRAQAERVAGRLRDDGGPFEAIYSSDLSRAWETAVAIGRALRIEPRPLPALREIDLGRWSGMKRDQVVALDGEVLERISSGEDLPRGGAERMADVFARVTGALERLGAEHPEGRIILVTHGGPVRTALLYAARDKDGSAPRRGHIGNTAVSVIRHEAGDWEIVTINDLSHLAESPQAPDLMAPQPPGDEEAAFEPEESGDRERRA